MTSSQQAPGRASSSGTGPPPEFRRGPASHAFSTASSLQPSVGAYGSSRRNSNSSELVDPLASWLNDREREFREFDQSFGLDPFASSRLFANQPAGFAGRRPLSLTAFPDSLTSSGDYSRAYYPQDQYLNQKQLQQQQKQQQQEKQQQLQQERQQQLQQEKQQQLRQQKYCSHPNMSSDDMSPKAKVTVDPEKFQVEFYVKGYQPEELSLKTEGNVLIVLAKQEVKEGGQTYVSKQFEQRFSLPSGVKPELISSSLSKDGYLTVTAPREQGSAIRAGQPRESIETTAGQVYRQSPQSRDEGLPQPTIQYDDQTFKISFDAKQYKPEDLDVKVEGNSIILTAKQEIVEAGGKRTRMFEQKFSLPSGVVAEKVTSSLTKEGVLVITAPRGKPAAANQSFTKTVESVQQRPSGLENRMEKVLNPASWEDDLFHSASPIKLGGASGGGGGGGGLVARDNFFDTDTSAFFDRNRTGSIFDNERSLFAANSEQSGVSRVEYDADTYKIHVKVDNFKPEELIVKTVDNTVQVEAKHEEKTGDGHSYSTRSFQQSFTMPRGVNLEAITSALSKDGVLTISAPLPPALKAPNSERMVPIKHN